MSEDCHLFVQCGFMLNRPWYNDLDFDLLLWFCHSDIVNLNLFSDVVYGIRNIMILCQMNIQSRHTDICTWRHCTLSVISLRPGIIFSYCLSEVFISGADVPIIREKWSRPTVHLFLLTHQVSNFFRSLVWSNGLSNPKRYHLLFINIYEFVVESCRYGFREEADF